MSVLVDIKTLSTNQKKQLNIDLLVKPVSNDTKVYKGFNLPAKKIVIECYDAFSFKSGQNNIEAACIPFSYYFQHLESTVPKLSLYEHKKIDIEFNGELLQRQKDIRQETLDTINKSKSVILSLHTGFGKTIFTLYLLSKMKLKAVVLCHRSIILEQWILAIKKYLPETTYCILGKKGESREADIMIANVINVPKKDRNFFLPFGTVVVDEIHTICTTTFSKALHYLFPKYLIGLSATPIRQDGLDRILELYVGPDMIVKNMNKSFNVYKIKTGFEPDAKQNVVGMLDWGSVLESQSKDKDRNQLIVNLCRYFSKRNILVLVNRKEHATILKEILKAYGEDVGIFMGSDKFCNYDCRILIATFSKGGVGFDHPKLDMLIAGGDVKSQFMQYIGRIFRRDDVSAIYIDLVDKMKSIENHSASRCKICKEIGGIVKNFEKCFPNFEEMIEILDS